MADARKNFAKATVSTTYGASATSIVLSAGHGARFPTPPFNATWWNALAYPDPSDDPNVEIVRVTAISTDTLTIARAQEGTAATAKNTAGGLYRLVAGLTNWSLSDAISGGVGTQADHSLLFDPAKLATPVYMRRVVGSAMVDCMMDWANSASVTGSATATTSGPSYIFNTGGTAGSTIYREFDVAGSVGTKANENHFNTNFALYLRLFQYDYSTNGILRVYFNQANGTNDPAVLNHGVGFEVRGNRLWLVSAKSGTGVELDTGWTLAGLAPLVLEFTAGSNLTISQLGYTPVVLTSSYLPDGWFNNAKLRFYGTNGADASTNLWRFQRMFHMQSGF